MSARPTRMGPDMGARLPNKAQRAFQKSCDAITVVNGPSRQVRCPAEFGRYRGNSGLRPAERLLWAHGLI
jgi:hypothetical protein